MQPAKTSAPSPATPTTSATASAAGTVTDDERLRRLLAQLAPWLALSADLRSVGCEPRQPGGGVPELTSSESASASGDLTKARAVCATLDRCHAKARTVLEELALYSRAHVPFATLAMHYATAHAPVALRTAVNDTVARRAVIEQEYSLARARVDAHRNAPTEWSLTEGPAQVRSKHDALESAKARAVFARSALQSWGDAALRDAMQAWDAASRGDDADD